MKKQSMKHHTSFSKNQSGIVSIMATVLIMLVISLIVLGFARIVRREQRQALDRQLNTQAFYAAEAGVNYAVDVIKDAVATGGSVAEKLSTCGPDGDFMGVGTPPSYAVDAANNVEFTCLLVDPSPPSLDYDEISTDKSRIINLRSANSSDNIETVTFSWEESGGGATNASGCTLSTFPPNSAWPGNCQAGVLRVDMVPTEAPFDRGSLVANTMTAFLYPKVSGSVTRSYASATGFGNQGAITEVTCDGTGARLCTLKVDGLASMASSSYLIRVKSIYKANALTITATTSSPTNEILGNQALIDSTGKAGDVLRRIKVRVPIIPDSDEFFPEFAIQSVDTICKQLLFSDVVRNACGNTPTTPLSGSPSFVSGPPGGGGGPALPPCGSVSSPDPFVNCKPPKCSLVPGGIPGENCVGDSGGGGGAAANPYTQIFTNNANDTVDQDTIASCTWNWGDGTTEGTTACKNGESITHMFPSMPATRCYIVTLTTTFTDGSQGASARYERMPRSSSAPCPDPSP